MNLNLEKILIKEFKRNNLTYNDKIGEFFEIYSNLLIRENKKYNLTSITDMQDIVDKHFIDSILGFEKLKLTKFHTNKIDIMDIGTGAGFPGIPIVLYDYLINNGDSVHKLHLLDSNKKKTDFLLLLLDHFNPMLPGKSINVYNNRLEKLVCAECKPKLFISRASGNINKVISYLAEFLINNDLTKEKSYFLYFGGKNAEILKKKYINLRKTNSKSLIRFNLKGSIVDEFEFSEKKYNRVMILYDISLKF